MADIESGGGNHPRGARLQRKKSTRIDMTAMVDVAFLLLTFFILTTTLAMPKAMFLTQPEPSEMEVSQTKLMTIILGENDKVHYLLYDAEGNEPSVHSTDFSDSGIRAAIQAHVHKRADRCPDKAKPEFLKATGCWDPIFVIKPSKRSKYKNVVDILDEIKIGNGLKYAIGDFTPDDSLLMAKHGLK